MQKVFFLFVMLITENIPRCEAETGKKATLSRNQSSKQCLCSSSRTNLRCAQQAGNPQTRCKRPLLWHQREEIRLVVCRKCSAAVPLVLGSKRNSSRKPWRGVELNEIQDKLTNVCSELWNLNTRREELGGVGSSIFMEVCWRSRTAFKLWAPKQVSGMLGHFRCEWNILCKWGTTSKAALSLLQLNFNYFSKHKQFHAKYWGERSMKGSKSCSSLRIGSLASSSQSWHFLFFFFNVVFHLLR